MKKIITYILLVLLGTLSAWSQIPSQAVKDLQNGCPKLHYLGPIPPSGYKAFEDKFGVSIGDLESIKTSNDVIMYEYYNIRVFQMLDSVYGNEWHSSKWSDLLKHIAGFEKWVKDPSQYEKWEIIGNYLERHDFDGARKTFDNLQLIEALYHYELKDTIDGIVSLWYDHQTANKIPAMVRSSNRFGHVCTNKIKALSWIIWIYRNETPINNYLVFKNAKDEVIYDYYCYKQEDRGVDEYGRINTPDVSFVKQPTDGYDELVNEIGVWIDLVKEVGIDEVRKKGIAPLNSIKYDIISYEEIMPELFEPSGYELKTIRGLVIDDLDFEPVPLVDIMIDDSVKIASTQLNGFFSILGPDTIKSLSFKAVGFEPMKVELCDDDYLEVIMISTSSDCFLTKDEAKKKTQKRFKQLGKLRKEALNRGIFQTKKPCYKQIYVP